MSLECLNKDVLEFVSSYSFVTTRLQGRKVPLNNNKKKRKKIYYGTTDIDKLYKELATKEVSCQDSNINVSMKQFVLQEVVRFRIQFILKDIAKQRISQNKRLQPLDFIQGVELSGKVPDSIHEECKQASKIYWDKKEKKNIPQKDNDISISKRLGRSIIRDNNTNQQVSSLLIPCITAYCDQLAKMILYELLKYFLLNTKKELQFTLKMYNDYTNLLKKIRSQNAKK